MFVVVGIPPRTLKSELLAPVWRITLVLFSVASRTRNNLTLELVAAAVDDGKFYAGAKLPAFVKTFMFH